MFALVPVENGSSEPLWDWYHLDRRGVAVAKSVEPRASRHEARRDYYISFRSSEL